MIQVVDGNADNLLIKWSFKLSSIIIQLSFFLPFFNLDIHDNILKSGINLL